MRPIEPAVKNIKTLTPTSSVRFLASHWRLSSADNVTIDGWSLILLAFFSSVCFSFFWSFFVIFFTGVHGVRELVPLMPVYRERRQFIRVYYETTVLFCGVQLNNWKLIICEYYGCWHPITLGFELLLTLEGIYVHSITGPPYISRWWQWRQRYDDDVSQLTMAEFNNVNKN